MKWKYIIVTEDGQYYGRNELDQDLIDQWESGIITILRTEDSTEYQGENIWGELEKFPTEEELRDLTDEDHV